MILSIAGFLPSEQGRALLLDQLDVDRDVDVFSEHEAAGVKRLVPLDAEVLAVEAYSPDEMGPLTERPVSDAPRNVPSGPLAFLPSRRHP